MPSKKRKKVEQKPLWQFDLTFDDLTMLETDGEYPGVKRLVEEDLGPHEWTVKTHLTIVSSFGKSDMILDFKSDQSLWIINYIPSSSSFLHNPDMSCLMQWSQLSGWKIPQPTEALVQSNVPFWKRIWETLLVDSDYLESRFGVRVSLRKEIEVDEDYGDIDEI